MNIKAYRTHIISDIWATVTSWDILLARLLEFDLK